MPGGAFFCLLLAFFAIFAASFAYAKDARTREGDVYRANDLVELVKMDPSLKLDIRYATRNNFVGEAMYDQARAFLQRPAAEALVRAHKKARKLGYGFLIYDAYRPWQVTQSFWQRFPQHRSYLADPAQGSRHNRGCAVDLILFDLVTGNAISMPSEFDDFSSRAHPNYEGGSAEARKARDLLRGLMESEGFTVYENEWWHFDYRDWQKYRVLNTPFDELH